MPDSVRGVGVDHHGGFRLSPPDHLCALTEAAAGGEFDAVAFEHLDRALCTDTLSREDNDVLPLLAPMLALAIPDHPMAGIVQGLRRRSRLRARTAQLMAGALESGFADLGIPTLTTGDLGAARRLYADPSERIVLRGTVVVPREVSHAVRASVVRRAADSTGAGVVAGRRSGLERFGVHIGVRSSLSTAFNFHSARRLLLVSAESDAVKGLEVAPEVLLLESIYQSAFGAPRIRWFTDAVFASRLRGGIRWDVFMRAAEECAWTAPAAEAMRVLALRGWAVPETNLAPDHIVDRVYWSTRSVTADGSAGVPGWSATARLRHRSWLAARIARKWLHA